jgi:hypothetical protein
VRREQLEAEQRAEAGRLALVIAFLVLDAAQRGCHHLAVHRLVCRK